MTTSLDEALSWVEAARRAGEALSIGLVGNAADIHPELVRRGVVPDIVTDQTPAHALRDYVPQGDLNTVLALRETDPAEYERRAAEVEGTDRRAKIRRGVLLSHARSHRRAARIWRWRAEMLSQEVHDE